MVILAHIWNGIHHLWWLLFHDPDHSDRLAALLGSCGYAAHDMKQQAHAGIEIDWEKIAYLAVAGIVGLTVKRIGAWIFNGIEWLFRRLFRRRKPTKTQDREQN